MYTYTYTYKQPNQTQTAGAQVLLSNEPCSFAASGECSNYSVCGTVDTVTTDQVYTVNCGGRKGKYISVYLPGEQRMLAVAEVEIFAAANEKEITASTATDKENAFDGVLTSNWVGLVLSINFFCFCFCFCFLGYLVIKQNPSL